MWDSAYDFISDSEGEHVQTRFNKLTVFWAPAKKQWCSFMLYIYTYNRKTPEGTCSADWSNWVKFPRLLAYGSLYACIYTDMYIYIYTNTDSSVYI